MSGEAKSLAHDLTNLIQGVVGYIDCAAAEESNLKSSQYYQKAASCAKDAVVVLVKLRKRLEILELEAKSRRRSNSKKFGVVRGGKLRDGTSI